MQQQFHAEYEKYDTPTRSPTTSDPAANGDAASTASVGSLKRKEAPLPAGRKPVKKVKGAGAKTETKGDVMSNADGDKDGESASKPKRVRTGCLTCRERHLKCDEGLPECNNCKKSNRVCKRGLKLNFIDTWAEQPPIQVSTYGTREWKVEFMDESRDIAGEYEGGTQRYQPLGQDVQTVGPADPSMTFDYVPRMPTAPNMSHQPLSSLPNPMPDSYPDPTQQPNMGNIYDAHLKPETNNVRSQPPPSAGKSQSNYSAVSSHSSLAPGSVGSYGGGQSDLIPNENNERREYLENQEGKAFAIALLFFRLR